jgi:hypothetical protein
MFTAEDVTRLTEENAALEKAAAEEDPLIGTLIRDKWKVLKRLGGGSFGTVYKVEDVKGGWIEASRFSASIASREGKPRRCEPASSGRHRS